MATSDSYHLKWKGQQSGPFSLREIEEKVQRREISSMHEIEVGGNWITMRAFMARRAAPAALQATVPVPQTSLPPPSAPPPPLGVAPLPRDARPAGEVKVPQAVGNSRAAHPASYPAADQFSPQSAPPSDNTSCFYLRSNFTLRVLAMALDAALFLAGVLVMQKLRWISLGDPPALQDLAKLPDAIWFCAWLLSWWTVGILMEGSPLQASLGKWALGLAVVDRNGMPLGTAQAFKRGALKLLGGLPFGFGWFMAAFNTESRCMHDMIADTHVALRVTATRIFH